ncbi:MAG: IS66 family transposase [Acidobacteria bacterium]|nr:IS66 family transposase [Acidobacteriota bacterium]
MKRTRDLEKEYRHLRVEAERLQGQSLRLRETIEQLEEEKGRLEKEKERLEQEKRQLQEQIEQLQRALLRPAAPFRRPEKKKIAPEEKRRPGRKPGHPGSYRPIPEQVDQRVEVPLEQCPQCGGSVHDVRAVEQYIEEIPAVRPQVSQIITYRGECSRCGKVSSRHPLQTSRAEGAARVQLGPRALSVTAELNKGLGLTMRKTCQVLNRLAGLRVTPGGISQALDRVAGKVEPLHRQLVSEMRQAPSVFVDETSWWVGEPGWWLWTFTNPQTTLFRVEDSRGSAVVLKTLGEKFAGILVSDCLASYDPLPYRKHKCISHHLKAISQARDRPRRARDPTYLNDWDAFFKTVIVLYKLAVSGELQTLEERIRALESWQHRLLGQVVTHPGDRIIQQRLQKQRPHLLGCLHDLAAEPTNNRAERALRPAVIARKLSCGNKTIKGKRTWEILASLAATARQRNIDLVHYLTPHLSLSP